VPYDDLTAEKPERLSLSFRDALQQIGQQDGTAFDHALTEVFCRIMREQSPQH
jgi:HD-GYP domain-containing protein (c-di-GMP phosphodiesterase class II)